MKTMLPLLTSLALLLPWLAAAQSPTVWRCGPEGRSYADAPCPQGRTVDVPMARPAEDVAAAHQRAAREQRLADELRRERLASEASARQTGAAGFNTRVAAVKPAARPVVKGKPKKTKHPAAGDTWPAAVPASRHVKG